MTEEEKMLLKKVLCEQMPYGIFINHSYRQNGVTFHDTKVLDICCLPMIYHWEDFKPYQRPLPSMTESEAMDIAEMVLRVRREDILWVKIENEGIEIALDDGVCSDEKEYILFSEIVQSLAVFDYLNEKHFDTRGIVHMGLAIAAVGNDNPYKEKGGEE